MKESQFVTKTSQPDFIAALNAALADGWEPYGQMHYAETRREYTILMMRTKKATKKKAA